MAGCCSKTYQPPRVPHETVYELVGPQGVISTHETLAAATAARREVGGVIRVGPRVRPE